MPSVESVIEVLEAFEPDDLQKILNYLEEVLVLGAFATEVRNEVKENRFAWGKACPHCGHDEVSRYGRFKGKQLFVQAHSTYSDTKLGDFKTWLEVFV